MTNTMCLKPLFLNRTSDSRVLSIFFKATVLLGLGPGFVTVFPKRQIRLTRFRIWKSRLWSYRRLGPGKLFKKFHMYGI